MRFRSLLIERYGCFEQATVPFDPAPNRINLVLAPNGAGKSVLRQAFHDLLFGIPLQSDMKFRFDYADMHLHADAVDEDGAAFGFGWRRRGNRTFQEPAEDAKRRFGAATGRITPRQVEHLFALDTLRLREGGRDLAAGGDGLGVALLSGSGELASARAVRTALDARRATLWKSTGRSGELAAALKALDLARKAMRDSVQPPKHRQALEEAIEAQARIHQGAEQAFARARADDRRLTRIERTRPHLAARAAASAWLAQHPDAPMLAASLADALPKAAADATRAASSLQERREFADRARATAEAIVRDQAILPDQNRLADLAERLGDMAAKRRDLPGVQRQLRAAEAEVERALRDLGAHIRPEEAERLVPDMALLARARNLIAEHAGVASARTAAGKRLAEAEQVLALLREEQDEAAPDPASLRALLDEMRADGDPQRLAGTAAGKVRTAEAKETACLARIPAWQGGIAALRSLAPPSDMHFARLDEARASAALSLKAILAECERREAERAAWQQGLDALREARVPDSTMLHAARSGRDSLWARIYRSLHDPGVALQDEESEPLALAFQRSLHEADALADRITADIARVEEQARLASSLQASLPVLSALQGDAARATQNLEQAERDWAQACAPSGLAAGAALAELRLFLSARLDAVAAAEAGDVARAELAALNHAHAIWATRLARELGAAPAPLPALVAQAEIALAAREAQAKATIEREARRRAASREQGAAAAAIAAADAQAVAWRASWAETLSALGRPGGEGAEATGRILPRLDDLRLHCRDAADKAVRVRDMQAEIAQFETEVAGLAAQFGEDPSGDLLATARALVARRDHAMRQETQWTASHAALEAARDASQDAERKEQAAAAHLATLLAACGAASLQEAEARLAASQTLRDRQTTLEAAEQALAAEAGMPLPALEQEAADAPVDMEEARTITEASLATAKDASAAALVALRQLEAQLEEARHATTATDAAASQEAAAALVSRLLDEELVLSVAASMLGHAMEAVEQGAGDAAIGRISHAFDAVTGGAYAIRAGDDGRGGTVLRAIEHRYPHERKAIAELSEGTRDQLYLALRLVAIEDHVAAGPRLPFIADDVLQTFDDARALASFHALLALSATVQVIVLTHHAHLLDVARGLPEGSVHVHRLD